MKVKFTETYEVRGGPRQVFEQGRTYDLPETQARFWANAGKAQLVDPDEGHEPLRAIDEPREGRPDPALEKAARDERGGKEGAARDESAEAGKAIIAARRAEEESKAGRSVRNSRPPAATAEPPPPADAGRERGEAKGGKGDKGDRGEPKGGGKAAEGKDAEGKDAGGQQGQQQSQQPAKDKAQGAPREQPKGGPGTQGEDAKRAPIK